MERKAKYGGIVVVRSANQRDAGSWLAERSTTITFLVFPHGSRSVCDGGISFERLLAQAFVEASSSQTVPAGMRPGAHMMQGTRWPPSKVLNFPLRSGPAEPP